MQIKKSYDVVNSDAISPEKGDNFTENPGIKPGITRIAETPGEKAVNDASAETMSKGQPFGKGGSGYTNKN